MGTMSTIFGMTHLEIRPSTYQSQSRHSNTGPLNCFKTYRVIALNPNHQTNSRDLF